MQQKSYNEKEKCMIPILSKIFIKLTLPKISYLSLPHQLGIFLWDSTVN